MPQREAKIIKSNSTTKKYVCVDSTNERDIYAFLAKDATRLKKFNKIIALIAEGIKNSELYKHERDGVYAIRMFPQGQNIRIYCKEMSGKNGTYYVIVSELLEKKKTQRNGHVENSLIDKVVSYEFKIK